MAKIEVPLAGCLRLIEPGPVVLLTAQYHGRPGVMTAAWLSPASYAPPRLVVAVNPLSNTHFLISKSQEFIVNIPGRPLAERVAYCGSVSGRDVDKFAKAPLTPADGRRVTAPWVEECLAHLECGVVDALEVGDHTLFLGQVVGAWAEEEAFDTFWKLEAEELSPLVHLGGENYARISGRFSVRAKREAESET